MAFTAQLVASSTIISLWQPNIPKEIWILVISIVCFLFNTFRVRRYGEIEYWLTVLKVCAVVGIIFAGILLPMNASPTQRLLGTDLAGNPVPCDQTALIYPCVASPGFNCIIRLMTLLNFPRLAGRCFQNVPCPWKRRPVSWALELLLSSNLFVHRRRSHRNCSGRMRKAEKNPPGGGSSCLVSSNDLLCRRCDGSRFKLISR